MNSKIREVCYIGLIAAVQHDPDAALLVHRALCPARVGRAGRRQVVGAGGFGVVLMHYVARLQLPHLHVQDGDLLVVVAGGDVILHDYAGEE